MLSIIRVMAMIVLILILASCSKQDGSMADLMNPEIKVKAVPPTTVKTQTDCKRVEESTKNFRHRTETTETSYIRTSTSTDQPGVKKFKTEGQISSGIVEISPEGQETKYVSAFNYVSEGQNTSLQIKDGYFKSLKKYHFSGVATLGAPWGMKDGKPVHERETDNFLENVYRVDGNKSYDVLLIVNGKEQKLYDFETVTTEEPGGVTVDTTTLRKAYTEGETTFENSVEICRTRTLPKAN